MKKQITNMVTSVVYLAIAILSIVAIIISIELIDYCGVIMIATAGLSVLTGSISLFASIVKAIDADLKWGTRR